jgi:hypothetical protein
MNPQEKRQSLWITRTLGTKTRTLGTKTRTLGTKTRTLGTEHYHNALFIFN